jgi:hypothetical protein
MIKKYLKLGKFLFSRLNIAMIENLNKNFMGE